MGAHLCAQAAGNPPAKRRPASRAPVRGTVARGAAQQTDEVALARLPKSPRCKASDDVVRHAQEALERAAMRSVLRWRRRYVGELSSMTPTTVKYLSVWISLDVTDHCSMTLHSLPAPALPGRGVQRRHWALRPRALWEAGLAHFVRLLRPPTACAANRRGAMQDRPLRRVPAACAQRRARHDVLGR